MKTIKEITVAQGYSHVDHLREWVLEANRKLSGRSYRTTQKAVDAAWKIQETYSGEYRDPRARIEFTDGTMEIT